MYNEYKFYVYSDLNNIIIKSNETERRKENTSDMDKNCNSRI